MVCGISSCLSPFHRELGPLFREMWPSQGAGRVSHITSGACAGPFQVLPGEVIRAGRGPASRAPISTNGPRPLAPTLNRVARSGAGQGRRAVGAGGRAARLKGCRAPGSEARPPEKVGRSLRGARLGGPSAMGGVIARGRSKPTPERDPAAARSSHPGWLSSPRVPCPRIACPCSHAGRTSGRSRRLQPPLLSLPLPEPTL